MAIELPDISSFTPPPPAFYFLVQFLRFNNDEGGSSLDLRFQKVSGLEITIPVAQQLQSGGQTLSLPGLPSFGTLTLERGYAPDSLVRGEFMESVENLKFKPQDVNIILLDQKEAARAAWTCYGALVTRWGLSDLDATQSGFLFETMELTYQRLAQLNP